MNWYKQSQEQDQEQEEFTELNSYSGSHYWVSSFEPNFLQTFQSGSDNSWMSQSDTSHYMAKAEKFLEEIRQNRYPDRPSRIGALFVSDTIEDAKKWSGFLGCSPCYFNEISVDGNIFQSDGMLVSMIFTEFNAMEEDPINYGHHYEAGMTQDQKYEQQIKKMNFYADSYWKGEQNQESFDPLRETIVQGKITVLDILDSSQI